MMRHSFKQFESPTKKKQKPISLNECTLNDSIFRKSIHWCVKTKQNIEHENQHLQTLAKQFNTILAIWRIHTEKNQNFNIIELKSIDDITKLPQFLTKALQVSQAIFMKNKFNLLSICVINKYGSFEADKCSSVCENCGEAQKLSQCCAQFICRKCSKVKSSQNCILCHQQFQVSMIPLETVESYQSKFIYQPMFPNLPLQQRFQLMDFVDAQLNYG